MRVSGNILSEYIEVFAVGNPEETKDFQQTSSQNTLQETLAGSRRAGHNRLLCTKRHFGRGSKSPQHRKRRPEVKQRRSIQRNGHTTADRQNCFMSLP